MKEVCMRLFSLVLVLLGGTLGCTSIHQSMNGGVHESSRKTYQLQKKWVKNTLNKENEFYRKIQRAQPVVVGDVIFQANSMDSVKAIDKANGKTLWSFAVVEGVEGGISVASGKIYFGGNDGKIYALNSSSGKKIWEFATRSEVFSKVTVSKENQVYALTGGNVLYALDGGTGKVLWSYTRQDTSQFSIRGGASPVVFEDQLFVGFSDGSFISFNRGTGSPLWELQLNKNKRFKDVDASAVVYQQKIYVSGYDDQLYCIDSLKGEILWKYAKGGYNPVSIYGDQLFYPTSSGELLAMNPENGKVAWTYNLKEGISTGVEFLNNVAVFGESQGSLVFLDVRTGKKMNSFEPGRGILATPAVDSSLGRVYFISGEGNLYSIEALWKTPAWIPYL